MFAKIIITLTLLSCGSCYGQSMDQNVIGSSGAEYTGGNASISITVGEVVIETVSNSTNVLTQGFHQPDLAVSGIQDLSPDISVSVYPNPTISCLTIDMEQVDDNVLVEIMDANGKTVHESSVNSKTVIDVDHLASGIYFLNLRNAQNQLLKSFKVQKVK
jgi:hypothetical protein